MGLIEKGQIYASNSFGDFVVLEDLCNSKYKIKFINTGYETIVSSAAILGGRVKDKYVPNIAGVGFLGSFEGKVTDKQVMPFYSSWNDMMNRCYNVTDKDYPIYGALGITVDPRWYNFGNFFEDSKTLPGYENKLREPTMYNLDKDYLQQDVPDNQKVYSKDTCVWLSRYDNTVLMGKKSYNNLYYGVIQSESGNYVARFNHKHIGTFNNAIAAANAYNHVRRISCMGTQKYRTIDMYNDVPYMSPSEYMKYNTKAKEMIKIIDK